MNRIIKYEFHVKIERLISKISSRFINININNIEEIFNKNLHEIGSVLEADRVYIFEFDQSKKEMNNTYEWCKKGISKEIDNLQGLSYDTFPWWMEKILNKEMIYIEDTCKMPMEASSERELLLAQNINSLIVLPIIVDNLSIGFFGVDNVNKTDIWIDNDQSLLKIISKIFSDSFSEIAYRKKLIEKNEYLDYSIKELKRLQSEIIQKEKMSVIGQLSSGLAHEMNNSLATMKGNIEVLDECYHLTIKDILVEYKKNHKKNIEVDFMVDEIGPIFDDIKHDFKKVVKIVDSIRKLTEAPSSLMECLNLNDLVTEVLWIYKSESHDEIEIALEFNQVSEIYCIRMEIEDAINSVLKNSIEAFRRNEIKKPKLSLKTYSDDDYATLEIIDNAGGISEEIIGRVFEPFYSTKAFGESYGLGLSQAYDIIVDRHNGKIKAFNIDSDKLGVIIKLPIDQKL